MMQVGTYTIYVYKIVSRRLFYKYCLYCIYLKQVLRFSRSMLYILGGYIVICKVHNNMMGFGVVMVGRRISSHRNMLFVMFYSIFLLCFFLFRFVYFFFFSELYLFYFFLILALFGAHYNVLSHSFVENIFLTISG